MTRPASSALVLDGEDIKARLMAERTATKCPVHVDWLRFTVYTRNILPSEDVLFPAPLQASDMACGTREDKGGRFRLLRSTLDALQGGDLTVAAQAWELAEDVAERLGEGFTLAADVRKGHDFYKHRWSIERNGSEVGWVGFGTSSSSPRQQAQARTLHVNLYGAACTFAEHGWGERMAALIDTRQADITRCDLALDFFDGMPGGVDQVVEDYKAGLCDSGGKRLKCNMVGDWINGKERSFYMGSKEAGKQTNVYEKGHQLFGADSGSEWLRVELRYGNKLRVLPSDMLRNPADFFAGASEWHALMLTRADAVATPEPVKTAGRLALETVQAEVHRNLKWGFEVAKATIAAAFKFAPDYEAFKALVSNAKLPGRLSKFNADELAQAYEATFNRFVSPGDGPSLAMAA